VRRTLVSLISKTPAALSLLGPTWRLTSIDGRQALEGVRVTAVFGDENRVSGSAGCNRYFGAAAVADQQMKVGLLATTRMYCGAAGVMPQEQAYLSALETATVYRITGTELQLGPAPGAVTLVFKLE
jgi:heat shock protein HslJ